MKNLFVSAGLVAIGAAAVQSAMADDATGPKYWTVGATLRGFYDDNSYVTPNAKASGGVEVSPTFSFHVPLNQTDLSLRYTYGLYYYQARQDMHGDVNPFDQTHDLDVRVDHAFDERWRGIFTDTFAVGQEPELLNPNPVGAVATPYRVNGNNLSNHGAFELDTIWTRLFSTTLSYNNGYFDYHQKGGTAAAPSLAGILDRDEESVGLDLKWQLLPQTIAFLGYSFSWVNFLGNEVVDQVPVIGNFNGIYHSSDRDSITHYVYVGVQQAFTPNLLASVRAGGTYTDVYADPLNPTPQWGPYANLSLTYTYLPGCYAQLGFSQDISATDQIEASRTLNAPGQEGITQYAKDSVVYVDVNHRFTPKLIGSVIGRMQYSTYEGGYASSFDSTDYGLGVNLTYQFNNHFSMDAGYNYDNVVSDLPSYGYSRNRVYLGLTVTY